MNSTSSDGPANKRRKVSDVGSSKQETRLTSNGCYWTSPMQSEIAYNWKIGDIDIMLTSPGVVMKSQKFSSKLSVATMYLEAQSNQQSLQVCLRCYLQGKRCYIWATGCSISVAASTEASQETPYKVNIPDQLLHHEDSLGNELSSLGASIPLESIPPGSITIVFQTTILLSISQQFFQKNPPIASHHQMTQMKSIFEMGKFWDTQLIVQDKTFKVHKVILASASDVFQRMFESDMHEKASGVVTISDVAPAVMSSVLTHIYTGDVPKLKTLAKELLIAADKYDLQDLVYICAKQLETELSSSNVCELLLLADRIVLGNSLRNECIKFIKDNYSTVSQSESWKILRSTSKELTLQAITSSPVEGCTTIFDKEGVSFLWIINDAMSLLRAKARIRGPKIKTKVFPYPLYSYLNFTRGNMSFQLTGDGGSFSLLQPKHAHVRALNCSFTVLNRETRQPMCMAEWKSRALLSQVNIFDQQYCCTVQTATASNSVETIESCMHDDSLLVDVRATIVNVNDCVQSSETDIKSKPTFYRTMKFMFESGSFSDLAIVSQKRIFHVHRVILASASEFFQELRQNTSKVKVDINPDVMSDVLVYIYTGEAPNIRSNTTEILLAADRYRVQDLVSRCLYELQLKLTSKNVATSLALVDQLTCGKLLKKACVRFITLNHTSVFKSDSWKELPQSLALEVAEQSQLQCTSV